MAATVDVLMAQMPTSPGGQDALDAGYLNAVQFERILGTLDDPLRKEARVPVARANAYRIARAAREFVDSVPNDPFTVLDISRALNVSRRTLQNGFA